MGGSPDYRRSFFAPMRPSMPSWFMDTPPEQRQQVRKDEFEKKTTTGGEKPLEAGPSSSELPDSPSSLSPPTGSSECEPCETAEHSPAVGATDLASHIEDGVGRMFPEEASPFPEQESRSHLQELAFKDALAYLLEVESATKDQPHLVDRFMDIVKKFKDEVLDIKGVADQIALLFDGHPDLVQKFGAIWPEGESSRVANLPVARVPEPGATVIKPAAKSDHPTTVHNSDDKEGERSSSARTLDTAAREASSGSYTYEATLRGPKNTADPPWLVKRKANAARLTARKKLYAEERSEMDVIADSIKAIVDAAKSKLRAHQIAGVSFGDRVLIKAAAALETHAAESWFRPEDIMIFRRDEEGPDVWTNEGSKNFQVFVKVGGKMKWFGPKGTQFMPEPSFATGDRLTPNTESEENNEKGKKGKAFLGETNSGHADEDKSRRVNILESITAISTDNQNMAEYNKAAKDLRDRYNSQRDPLQVKASSRMPDQEQKRPDNEKAEPPLSDVRFVERPNLPSFLGPSSSRGKPAASRIPRPVRARLPPADSEPDRPLPCSNDLDELSGGAGTIEPGQDGYDHSGRHREQGRQRKSVLRFATAPVQQDVSYAIELLNKETAMMRQVAIATMTCAIRMVSPTGSQHTYAAIARNFAGPLNGIFYKNSLTIKSVLETDAALDRRLVNNIAAARELVHDGVENALRAVYEKFSRSLVVERVLFRLADLDEDYADGCFDGYASLSRLIGQAGLWARINRAIHDDRRGLSQPLWQQLSSTLFDGSFAETSGYFQHGLAPRPPVEIQLFGGLNALTDDVVVLEHLETFILGLPYTHNALIKASANWSAADEYPSWLPLLSQGTLAHVFFGDGIRWGPILARPMRNAPAGPLDPKQRKTVETLAYLGAQHSAEQARSDQAGKHEKATPMPGPGYLRGNYF